MNTFLRTGSAMSIAIPLLVSAACVTRTVQNRIEVQGNASIEEKVTFAKTLITEARFSRLKQQLKGRFPALTEAQLDNNLGLRWDVVTVKPLDGGSAASTVFVSVIGRVADGFDADAVVAAAVEILTPEINAPASESLLGDERLAPEMRLQPMARNSVKAPRLKRTRLKIQSGQPLDRIPPLE